MASGKDKDTIDLYDGDIDLLDYGDDLEADLLDGNLAGVGGYDDLELGAEDELELDLLPLDAVSSSTSNKKTAADQNGTTTASATKGGQGTAGNYGDDVAYDGTDYTAEVDASVAEGASSKTNNNNNQSTSNDENWDASPSSATTSQKPQPYNGGQSEAELGGINRQSSSPSDDRSSYKNNYNNNASSSPRGDGRSGGLRGRGNQGYVTGTGRGNYQGGRGGNMLGMGINQQQIYAMQQMGMNMNMGMGMNSGRYSGDGYGNQGMGYPYNSGAGMGGGGAGTPGRTIHINPKFQNRAGVPAIPGATTASTTATTTTTTPATAAPAGLDRALGQEQRQGSRQFHQDSGNGQSPGRGNQSSRSGSQDRFDGDRFNRNQQFNNGRGDSRDGRGQQGGSGYEQGGRSDGSYRSPGSSERDFGQGLSTSRDFSSRSGDSPRTPRPHSPLPSYNNSNNRSSPIIRGGGGSPGSISSRLTPGLKRAGGGSVEESQKAHKSSGVSTPRGEHSRSSTSQGYGSDAGSVSFLRDRRDGGDGGEDGPQQRQREQASSSSNAVPTGFVKVDNIPDSVSDASIRQLAHGISGVGRVLTVSKKGDRTIVLGFASVDEAKFFRRQINRTSIEGSLVTVTLTSA